jgi:hypothetical protein
LPASALDTILPEIEGVPDRLDAECVICARLVPDSYPDTDGRPRVKSEIVRANGGYPVGLAREALRAQERPWIPGMDTSVWSKKTLPVSTLTGRPGLHEPGGSLPPAPPRPPPGPLPGPKPPEPHPPSGLPRGAF